MNMTKQHTQAIIARHGPDGGEELNNKMWQFVALLKALRHPRVVDLRGECAPRSSARTRCSSCSSAAAAT